MFGESKEEGGSRIERRGGKEEKKWEERKKG